MEKRIFVDVHVIQTVPPSCVNRDDSGSPKTAVYGGVNRARVSSQSWKRAMRLYFRDHFDEEELGVRTMKIVELVSKEIQKKNPEVSAEDAQQKAQAVIEAAGISVDAKKKGKNKETEGVPEAKALFFMSMKQAENLAELALQGGYDKKTVQNALKAGYGVDLALFGRMVADDPSLNADASAQVAHSISTHRVDNEYDYYTALDEMASADNAGAGMIGTVEFNSATLYRYATVAVHALNRQLAENPEATAKAVEEFVRAFVMSMPSGKQNTFANRTLPDAVLITVRNDQPINLAGAFEAPIQSDHQNGGYALKSAVRLAEYEGSVCTSFAPLPVKSWMIGRGLEQLGPSVDLSAALETLRQYLVEEF